MELKGIIYSIRGHVLILTIICLLFETLQSSAFPSGQVQQGRQNKRSVLRSREPRSGIVMPGSVNMQTLINASIMICSDAMAQPKARMVHLTDDHMRALLQHKGGNYVKDYMAVTQEEALENFPNMLILTKPLQESDSTFSIMDNLVTKQTIIDDLNKLTAYLMGITSTSHDNSTQSVKNNSSVDSGSNPNETFSTKNVFTSENIQPKSEPSNAMTTSSTSFDTAMPSTKTISNASNFETSHYLTRNTNFYSTYKHDNLTKLITTAPTETTTSVFNRTPLVSRNSSGTPGTGASTSVGTSTSAALGISTSIKGTTSRDQVTSSLESASSNSVSPKTSTSTNSIHPVSKERLTTSRYPDNLATVQAKATTLDPEVLKGLEALKNYVQGSNISTLNNGILIGKRDLDTVWRNANTTLHPATLLGLAAGNRRVKRQADGSYSHVEYCQNKGSLTPDHKFVHLCSTCATTTKLSDDIFPQYINEAICKTGDTACFTIAGKNHGQCKQTKFSLHMLRRKPGHCNMIIHGGEVLVFDNWELAPQLINVSCECTINKLSVFNQFAGQSVPFG